MVDEVNSPDIVFDNDEEIRKKIDAIKSEFRKRKRELIRDQEVNGFVQIVNGGLTYRLGNEIEDFDHFFGYPKP